MKYYYKSPQELLTRAPQRRQPRRNRTRWILVADLVVLVLVFGVLYYRGDFSKGSAASVNQVRLGALQLSASYPGDAHSNQLRLYLHARNSSSQTIRLPGHTAPLDGLRVHFARPDASDTVCTPEPYEPIEVPGQGERTLILACPRPAPGEVQMLISFETNGGRKQLRFPRVTLRDNQQP